MSSKGFTLIELVTVVVILGVLAAVAVPRFLDLGQSSRVAVVKQLQGVAISTSNMFNALGKIGISSQPVSGRPDLTDVDVDGDGTFETRLKWGYLDNTDLEKRMILSDRISIQYQGIDLTYFGYDFDGNGNVSDNNCYFRYRQANNQGDVPEFTVVTSSC